MRSLLLSCSLALAAACGGGSESSSPAGAAGATGGGDAGSAGSAGETGAAGSEAAGSGGSEAGGSGGSPPLPLEPTLASLQAGFFTPSCATSLCHGSKQKAGGISLATEAESCASLVGQVATEKGAVGPNSCAKGGAAKAGMLRVTPGSPDESFVYLKVTATEKCVTVAGALAGDRMPKGKPAASAEAVSALGAWITAGALCQ